MIKIDEAAEVRREASGLLRLLSITAGQPRYAMGERVSVAIQVAPVGAGGDEYRIEVLCHAFGSLDADWGDCQVVLADGVGKHYKFDLNRLGRAAKIYVLSPGVVLRGFAIESSAEPVVVPFPGLRVLAAAAKTALGELFTETHQDFMSADGRVQAKVHCAKGGDLSVVFEASSEHADLLGARIQFLFFTDAGTELGGERELWPDDWEKGKLTAFWGENQTSLAPAWEAGSGGSEKKVNLAFQFEVLPPRARAPEE